MANDLKSSVETWLQDSGYPLEMFTAEEFRREAFMVWQASYYDDAETQKPREIDVYANAVYHSKWALLRVVCVVECKSSRKAPWVVFAGDVEHAPLSPRDFVRWGASNAKGELLRKLLADRLQVSDIAAFHTRAAGYGVVQAKLKKQEQEDKGGDASYTAMMQACKAALAFTAQSSGNDQAAALLNRYTTIGFPVIVLDGSLFAATLKQGQLDVREVPRHVVWVRHPDIARATFVSIVTKNDLPTFVTQLRKMANAMANWCRNNEEDVAKALGGEPPPEP